MAESESIADEALDARLEKLQRRLKALIPLCRWACRCTYGKRPWWLPRGMRAVPGRLMDWAIGVVVRRAL